jgi:hypothetical protein
MKTLLTVVGVALIVISFYEQFQTLFHPPGHGTTTDWISRTVWRMARRVAERRPGWLSLAGPFALIAIILSWASLVVFGCALIYFPRLGSFAVPQDLVGKWTPTFFSAINIAFASLITVSPSVTPTDATIRMMMTLQGAVGLALVTASISWLLSIYPVLEGRSSIAEQAMSLFEAERGCGRDVFEMNDSELTNILFAFAGELSTLRNQTVQFPITYYFGVQSRRASLEMVLPYIDGIATRACEDGRSASLQIAGHALEASVLAYVRLLGHRFLHKPGESKEVLLQAYSQDHLREALPITPEAPATEREQAVRVSKQTG